MRALTDLAKEEIDHFQRVVSLLEVRGLALGAPPVDTYAESLRRAARALPRDPSGALLDRLLVGALIEARSCERFKLLLQAVPEGSELRPFYAELFASEARHYTVFVELAHRAASGDAARVDERLGRLARIEADLVQSNPDPRATIHG